jgi:hypothetical protein
MVDLIMKLKLEDVAINEHEEYKLCTVAQLWHSWEDCHFCMLVTANLLLYGLQDMDGVIILTIQRSPFPTSKGCVDLKARIEGTGYGCWFGLRYYSSKLRSLCEGHRSNEVPSYR